MIKLCTCSTELLRCSNCLRNPENTGYTEGQLYIDGKYFDDNCDDYLDADFLKMFPKEEYY